MKFGRNLLIWINSQLDIDQNPTAFKELGGKAVPTFYFIRDGEKVGEVVGANPSAVQAAIEKYI